MIKHNKITFHPVEFNAIGLKGTSIGGLPQGVSDRDFFSGLSVPRNKEIMRVFRDLEMVEQMGSGIPRILLEYDRSIFTISENYIRITFPYEKALNGSQIDKTKKPSVKTSVKTSVKKADSNFRLGEKLGEKIDSDSKLGETQVKTPALILQILKQNPNMTLADVGNQIGKSKSTVERTGSKLVKEGKMKYISPQKGGHWEVIENDEN
jgi:ATP-dependent DNA helicase RecG